MSSGGSESDLAERLARVAEKLRLTAQSGAASPFRRVRAKNEPYVLNPPLSPARLAEFERARGARLPEEYRRFLLEVGDGDTANGLYSLDQAYEESQGAWGDHESQPDFLAKPSHFRPDFTCTWEWWASFECPDDRMDQLQGTLPIQEGGCSDFYLIVVTGADAGAIYSADWDENALPARVGADFLSWLERNIDARALGYVDGFYESGVRGSVGKLASTVTDDPHEYRRLWAVVALGRRRRLPQDARRALARALTDDHYVVRAAAVAAVGRRGVEELVPVVRRAIGDTAAEVRTRALHTLDEVDSADIVEVARSLLADPVPQLREQAARLLRRRAALTTADVAAILDDSEWTVRREAVHGLPCVSDPDSTLLTKALSDDNSAVRWEAVNQIVERDDPALDALLPVTLERETDFSLKLKLQHRLGVGPYAKTQQAAELPDG